MECELAFEDEVIDFMVYLMIIFHCCVKWQYDSEMEREWMITVVCSGEYSSTFPKRPRK